MNRLVMGIVSGIIGIVVIFYIFGAMAPTLVTASGQITASGLPLASLFSSTGVLFVLMMIFLFMGLLGLAMKFGKTK